MYANEITLEFSNLTLKHLLLTLLLSLILYSDTYAFVYVEQEGVYLYFPEGEERIAESLKASLPGMLEFLENKGLKVSLPLHVVIDDKWDIPRERAHMIPHREIRVPLKAPGVFEDGFMVHDPWAYFLFRGLCRQGIYALRGGLPYVGHRIFGEVSSPNIIIPPWLEDGICTLLYEKYSGLRVQSLVDRLIFESSDPPDISNISNHPEIWPGYFSYRVYGRPFMAWFYRTYGWEGILDFLEIHGRGIIPIEIDLKAKDSLGKTWPTIWEEFKNDSGISKDNSDGLLITGYWPEPFVYWNFSSVIPGIARNRFRGRYGYFDERGEEDTLWISEYSADGISKIIGFRGRVSILLPIEHVSDPGQGGVAVIMEGSRPKIIILPSDPGFFDSKKKIMETVMIIPSPPGAIQLSGPVRNPDGIIAVAANVNNNWDIWIYNGDWQRITDFPSIETDPWWDKNGLVFASNITGKFQIHTANMKQLTNDEYMATLPRAGDYLSLVGNGLLKKHYKASSSDIPISIKDQDDDIFSSASQLDSRPYTPLKSVMPNYWRPDMYVGQSDVQLGMVTNSRDVTGDYRTNAGFRYSTDIDYFIFRLGINIKEFGSLVSRYPLSYDPRLRPQVEESRLEARLFWEPGLYDFFNLRLSFTRLSFEPLDQESIDSRIYYQSPPDLDEPYILWDEKHEHLGAVEISKQYGELYTWATAEFSSRDYNSLYGGFRFMAGENIYGVFILEAGHTWGDVIQGHGTFRIGGDVGEGYFTRRPSRLFPLRGFKSNVLEAKQAATTCLEIFWPLLNIQKGYKTLPLFLKRIRLGTFIDLGACHDSMTSDDVLIGAGFEFVTSMEFAWDIPANFRFGMAWPVRQPDYYPSGSIYDHDDLDEKGPQYIVQLGMPL